MSNPGFSPAAENNNALALIVQGAIDAAGLENVNVRATEHGIEVENDRCDGHWCIVGNAPANFTIEKITGRKDQEEGVAITAAMPLTEALNRLIAMVEEAQNLDRLVGQN
jgi:hypothetical protein